MSLKQSKKKGPLFVTVALLFASPILLSESAVAASSDGVQPYSSSLAIQQALANQRSPLGLPLQSQSRTTPSQARTKFAQYLLSSIDLNDAQSKLAEAQEQLRTVKSNLSQLRVDFNTLTQKFSELQNDLEQYNLELTTAESELAAQQTKVDDLRREITNLQSSVDNATNAQSVAAAALANQLSIKNSAEVELAIAQGNLEGAQQLLTNKETVLSSATAAKADAQTALDQAQSNYDNNLIPDPNWTAPTYQKENTRLVPYTEIQLVRTLVPRTTTTFQEQVIPNLLPDPTLTSTEGWSGVYPGWQGSQPGMYDGEITFSYMDQTVTQGLYSGPFENATLTLSADWFSDWTADSYSMTVTAEDINRNPVGTATYTNTRTAHDWTNRSVTLQATGPVSYITISFSGIDHGFWYGMYGPRMKNPALEVSYGQYVTETTYEEVITYEEVTKYREEIYYTTEPVVTQGTINVSINEGGQATFTAPEGAVFTGSSLRYEAKERPECGVDISPNLIGLSTITIQASNGVWGDPCGGWYKHIVGTLTYLGQPTAPLIHDPALKVILDEAEAQYVSVNAAYLTASQEVTNAQSTVDALVPIQQEKQSAVTTAVSDTAVAQQTLDTADVNLVQATDAKSAVDATLTTEEQTLITKQASVTSAKDLVTVTSAKIEETNKEVTTTNESITNNTAKIESLNTTIALLEEEITEFKNQKPDPVDEGSKEIPAELSAENLMEVNIEEVDPTELTPAQAEQLKEAALETFLTAEEGSAEYEQALDALYLAAEEDDLELPQELAAIPGLAGAVELVNFFGNAGADMSPETREESKKVVVTAVVAAGAAIQAAAGAATGAATSSASSAASGSGSPRRK
jgi:uncharacterized coiled-coil DUF342 family protein